VKTQLVITDVTRMQEGRVCVAGYTHQRECVRPVLPHPGIHETMLYANGKPIIFPFAVVEYDLLERVIAPPHTEDWRYDPRSVRGIKRVDEKDRRVILDRLVCPSVAAIFNAKIFSGQGHYLLIGQGERSLGTVRPKPGIEAIIEPRDDAWKYRLRFADQSDAEYRLAITDLTWRYFCDAQKRAGTAPEKLAAELTDRLRSSQVYVRIGLARGWDEHPARCYLQITGVYTFPDFLEGKTFADFVSPA